MDCMTLSAGAPDKLDFAFLLEFTNGHTCEMSGSAEHVEGASWRHETGECELELSLGADAVVLRDRSGACRREFCGASGSIDEASFSTAALSPDGGPCSL